MAAVTGVLRQYLENKYGAAFDYTIDTVSVGTSGASLIGADPQRVALILCNFGPYDIYYAQSMADALTAGIYVSSYGGTMTLTIDDDFIMPQLPWFGSTTGGDTDVYVISVRAL